MRTNNEQLSSVAALFLRWWALWHIAMTLARGVAMTKKFDPARAAKEAAQLEVWTRCAIFALLGEIAALEAGEAPLSKQDKVHLFHARGTVGALAMLCALAAKMRRESLGAAGFAARTLHEVDENQAPSAIIIRNIGYLDSS